MLEVFYKTLVCHFIGDYVLQNDFLAKTKGENWWHLIAHCVLYTAMFSLMFGFDLWILYLFGTHIVIDALKARYKKINYIEDQIYHLMTLIPYVLHVLNH